MCPRGGPCSWCVLAEVPAPGVSWGGGMRIPAPGMSPGIPPCSWYVPGVLLLVYPAGGVLFLVGPRRPLPSPGAPQGPGMWSVVVSVPCDLEKTLYLLGGRTPSVIYRCQSDPLGW